MNTFVCLKILTNYSFDVALRTLPTFTLIF